MIRAFIKRLFRSAACDVETAVQITGRSLDAREEDLARRCRRKESMRPANDDFPPPLRAEKRVMKES